MWQHLAGNARLECFLPRLRSKLTKCSRQGEQTRQKESEAQGEGEGDGGAFPENNGVQKLGQVAVAVAVAI